MGLEMKNVFKYLLWFFGFLMLVLYYFFMTKSGEERLCGWGGSYLSKELNNSIEIKSLNLWNYPKISTTLRINSLTDLDLEGEISSRGYVALNYHLKGQGFRFDNLRVEDKIDLQGTIHGKLQRLSIDGKGELFGGKGDYQLIKEGDHYSDLVLHLKEIKTAPLMKLAGVEKPVHARLDLNGTFSEISKLHQKGEAWFALHQIKIDSIEENLSISKAYVHISDALYRFNGKLEASHLGEILIEEGEYHGINRELMAQYNLDIPKLERLEPYVGHRYYGQLKSQGKLKYSASKGVDIQGKSHDFGGDLKYHFFNNHLQMHLRGVELARLLQLYGYPAPLKAELFGSVDYSVKNERLLVDTKLRKAHFQKSQLTEMLRKTAGIDLRKHLFDKSHLMGTYHHGLFEATLKVDDGKEHLYFNDIKLHTQKETIESRFELKMHHQEIYGTVHGSLKNPQISIDMKKLLRYQMDQQIGSILEHTKDKNIQKDINQVKEILNGVDMDQVTDQAKKLFEGLF